MVVLGTDDAIESIRQAAEAWLAELPRERLGDGRFQLPSTVYAVALQARSAGSERDRGVPRARVKTEAVPWRVLHASRLRGAADDDDRVAVVIESAEA